MTDRQRSEGSWPFDIGTWLAQAQREVSGTAGAREAVLRRRFDAPIEQVWRAWTDRERLGRWFGGVEGELRLGATLRLNVGAPHAVTSTVLRCEPPRSLLVTWGYQGFAPDAIDQIELELSPTEGGTWLELKHRSGSAEPFWTGVGPGWEEWLYRLSALLAGADVPRDGADTEAREARCALLWEQVPVPAASAPPR